MNDERVATAVDAAVRAAAGYAHVVDDPRVIEETNNVVVWLYPRAIIAKVGRWSHSVDPLVREHKVAAALADQGAPIAPPLRATLPVHDEATGFVVTLWQRLDVEEQIDIAPVDVAVSLRDLHRHLDRYEGDLPDFRRHVALARSALDDDRAMWALSVPDRQILQRAIDTLCPRIDAFDYSSRTLHGEPHLGNVVATSDGPRWIDLEDVCIGPLEWDLAFLPDEAAAVFSDEIDDELFGSIRVLNSACVSTWCWVRADIDGMLQRARHHLERVKSALPA